MKRSDIYKTPHWRALRKRLIENNDGAFCILCGKHKWKFLKRSGAKRSQFKAHLHHMCYDRAGHELDTDLLLLCPRCHTILHSVMNAVDSPGYIHDLKEVVLKYVPGALLDKRLSR